MHQVRVVVLAVLLVLSVRAAQAGEVLYNGIELPEKWPPPQTALSRKPSPLPHYLVAPPAVIRIDVGRQLFVDDFLVENTTLTRTHYQAEYHPSNPLVKPENAAEGKGLRARAAVFSDGVWYDPADKIFKMWYWGGPMKTEALKFYSCYATSKDGIHWEKPALKLLPGTSAIIADDPDDMMRNSSTVWLDLDEKDPARRYKYFHSVGKEEENVDGKKQYRRCMRLYFSADGIHWTRGGDSDQCGDRSTVFYNGFRKVWVYGIRTGDKNVSRCRAYHEDADVVKGLRWGEYTSKLWVGADELDPSREDLELRRVPERPWDLVPSQLYNLDCIAYESVMLGMFTVWRGHPLGTRPKINEVCVGYSRDGFNWTRPDRRAFYGVSENKDAWNWGNVQSGGGGCLVVGDKLYFYMGGTKTPTDPSFTSLATLRRDGFTSMDAGEKEGTLTTRPVQFSGKYMFVNLKAPAGALRAEIIDAAGKPIAPFTADNCVPAKGDSTLLQLKWNGAEDLSALAGKPVRFRFHLTQGSLYAFWVSPAQSGASHGFVAAGGPGFTAHTDTVGSEGYPKP